MLGESLAPTSEGAALLAGIREKDTDTQVVEIVDLVGVPLNFANGFAFSGFVYVLYGALVLWGMRDWWLRSRKAGQPVLEGAPA